MVKRFRTYTIFVVLLFVLLPAPVLAADEDVAVNEPAEIDLLEEGLALYRAQQFDAALPMLLSTLDVESDLTRLHQAHLALARIYLANRNYDKALEQIAAIPVTMRGDEGRYVEGRALVALRLTREGVAALQGINEMNLPSVDRGIRLRILAEGNAALGNDQKALWFAHQSMLKTSAANISNLYAFASEIIDHKVDEALLPEIAFMFSGSSVGTAARLKMARNALDAGDRQTARMQVVQANIGMVPGAYRASAIKLYTALTGENWLQRAVGVVLPLSGRFSAFGELIRRGMELALELQGAQETGIRFLFRDGAADPIKSQQAVQQLATGDKALAIAGPITGSASEAAAQQAQSEKIPLLTLSQRDQLPETGPYIFRNSLTSKLQAQELARYAIEELGMSSFGVLYPDNRLGREMLELFSEEVRKRNGLVVASESYLEEDNDFGRQIKLLKGEDPSFDEEDMTDQEILEDLFVPDFPPVDFDALFIPDYADRVGMIVPQLAYYGIEELPLLGINGWNSPDLLRLAGPFVEGALFVDGFYAYSSYPFVKEFVNRYFEKYGEEPTILEAQGFDVANIFISLLARDDVRSRDDLRLALSQLANYPGVTGATTFNLVGDADKVLFVLQVQNGNIVQVNSPENDLDELPVEEDDATIPAD